MPRYFFDICLDDHRIADEEGMECGDLNAALNEARLSARELASAVLQQEADLEKACIEIRDGKGETVAAMAVAEIVSHPLVPQFEAACGECERPGGEGAK
jgi:hypothetical protein